MQLVLNELSAAEVVVIATPELTKAALGKLDADKEYTHLQFKNNTRLQVNKQCLCLLATVPPRLLTRS